MINLSRRLQRIENSGYIWRLVEERKKGIVSSNIIDFIPGYTNFYVSPPKIDLKIRRYIDPQGYRPLREKIAQLESAKVDIPFTSEDVLITAGTTIALYHLSQCLFNEEDEILTSTPYWHLYPTIFGLSCKFGTTINSSVKAVLINSPSYCGDVFEESYLKYLAMLARENGWYVISDDVFDIYFFKNETLPRVGLVFRDFDRLVIVNSPSKSYNVGGWRIGYCVTKNHELLKAMYWHQVNTSYGASTLSQIAYLKVLENKVSYDLDITDLKNRRDYLVSNLRSMGFECKTPEGGVGVFPRSSNFYKSLGVRNSDEFTLFLLDKAQVIIGSGSRCGDDSHSYLSFGIPVEKLEEGIYRLRRCLNNA